MKDRALLRVLAHKVANYEYESTRISSTGFWCRYCEAVEFLPSDPFAAGIHVAHFPNCPVLLAREWLKANPDE